MDLLVTGAKSMNSGPMFYFAKKPYTPPKTSENLITCQWKITILMYCNQEIHLKMLGFSIDMWVLKWGGSIIPTLVVTLVSIFLSVKLVDSYITQPTPKKYPTAKSMGHRGFGGHATDLQLHVLWALVSQGCLGCGGGRQHGCFQK